MYYRADRDGRTYGLSGLGWLGATYPPGTPGMYPPRTKEQEDFLNQAHPPTTTAIYDKYGGMALTPQGQLVGPEGITMPPARVAEISRGVAEKTVFYMLNEDGIPVQNMVTVGASIAALQRGPAPGSYGAGTPSGGVTTSKESVASTIDILRQAQQFQPPAASLPGGPMIAPERGSPAHAVMTMTSTLPGILDRPAVLDPRGPAPVFIDGGGGGGGGMMVAPPSAGPGPAAAAGGGMDSLLSLKVFGIPAWLLAIVGAGGLYLMSRKRSRA